MSWTFPTSYRVVGVTVAPNLVLAPMEGVTDLLFRRLIRSIGGCGLTVTEFVPARNLTTKSARTQGMIAFDPDERPVAIQIYGRDPEAMAVGAKIVEDLGADFIDVNMGCPSKKVCAHSGGSALLKEPDLAQAIVVAVRAAVKIPFTVKMRSGWDPAHRNAPELAYLFQEEGVDAITVHWRTRTDLFSGERELDTIREVVRRLRIPVLANGDIVDVESARSTLEETGAAGVMIGRGAVRNPWVFRQIADVQAGRPPRVVDDAERARTLLAFFEILRANFGTEHRALCRLKKIARYFTDGIAGGEVLRTGIFHSETPEQAIAAVHAFFEGRSAA